MSLFSILNVEELEARDLEAFQTGPLSVLTTCVKANSQTLICCRNNRKLLARIKAFDRHMNMILECVKEMWSEVPRKAKKQIGSKKLVNKDRFMSKMFLRGASIVIVLSNPSMR